MGAPLTPSMLAKFGSGAGQFATLQNMGGTTGTSMSSFSTSEAPDFKLPDWLSTDPNVIIDELMKEYSGTGTRFNPAGIARSYDESIRTTQGMGGQIADNAMREASARAQQEGGSVNSAMVKAQSMLPVYDATNKLRTDKALAVADVRQREAGLRAQLAQVIGQMRTGYLSMLADTYMKGKSMNASWLTSQQQYALERERMSALASSGPGTSAASRSVVPFSGMITRAPNNSGMGGVEYTPQFLDYLKTNGLTAPPAPQYPRETGISGGPALDGYMAMLRKIGAIANPGLPEYNAEPVDLVGSFGGNGYYSDPSYDPVTRLYSGKQVVRPY